MKGFFDKVKLVAQAVGGNAEAQYEFGKDKQTTVWLERAAKKGHDGAMYELGTRYEAGNVGLKGYVSPGSTKNPDKARELYEKAVGKGHVEAMFRVAGLCEKEDPQKALGLYEKAAKNGHVEAMCSAGQLYKNTDPQKSVAYFQQAAAQGSAHGKLGLAGFHAGFYPKDVTLPGVEKNSVEGVRLLNEITNDEKVSPIIKKYAQEAIDRLNPVQKVKAVAAEPSTEAVKTAPSLTLGEKIKERFGSHNFEKSRAPVELGLASAKKNPLFEKQPFSGDMPDSWAGRMDARSSASKGSEGSQLGR